MHDPARSALRRLPAEASIVLASIVLASIVLALAACVLASPARADKLTHRFEIIDDEARTLGAFLTIRGERQRRKPLRTTAHSEDRTNLVSTMEARWQSFDLTWQQALKTLDTETMTRTMPTASTSLRGRWRARGKPARTGPLSHAEVRLAQTRTSRTIDAPSVVEIATLAGGPLSREVSLVLGLSSGTSMSLSSRSVRESGDTRFSEILEARQSGRLGRLDLGMAGRYERPRSDLDAAVMAGELNAAIEPLQSLRLLLASRATRLSLHGETNDSLGLQGGLEFEAAPASHAPAAEPWRATIEAGADFAGRKPGQRPDRMERAHFRLGMSRRF